MKARLVGGWAEEGLGQELACAGGTSDPTPLHAQFLSGPDGLAPSPGPIQSLCCHTPPPCPLVCDLSSSDDLDTFEECWLVILQTVPLFGFVWGSCHDWAGVLGLGRAWQGRAPVH